jgi:shikimate kinase/3-dehydroquinate synthase
MIFLYGPPGSGKSMLGEQLARNLDLPFHDLDQLIVDKAGMDIPHIFSAEGEESFRRRESTALDEILAQTSGVIALGGGSLLDVNNRSRVEAAGKVLCLTASLETLWKRVKSEVDQRPLLQGDAFANFRALLERRADHYASFLVQLDTGNMALEETTWAAQVRLGIFHVSGMGEAYDVQVSEGGINHLGEALKLHGLKGPVALVSDDHVAPFYAKQTLEVLKRARYESQVTSIPPGEAYKTMTTVQSLWEVYLAMGLERSSTVVALGGGVVGDLAGFAAATYLRGVHWVMVPTTLLAMCDASLGGKTGVDLPQGKNLVGAYHPPSLVLADPATLSTLPEAEFRNGLAEVVKHGVINDPLLFDLCRQGWDAVFASREEIVCRSMAVKVRIIQDDPFERGKRASLNFGHTLGHALEVTSNYCLKHGEAVAIGMVSAARLAERLGLADHGLTQEISDTLQHLGLPITIPASLDSERILAAMRVDKKRAAGKTHFVLPIRVGEVRWGVLVEEPGMILAA